VERFRADEVDACLLVATWPVCHESVGLVALALEAAGIPTVSVFTRPFRHVAGRWRVPPVLITPHLVGCTIGPVGDRARQREVVEAALRLLVEAGGPETHREI
jgi:D-proline reductase (dithiol) PrdB